MSQSSLDTTYRRSVDLGGLALATARVYRAEQSFGAATVGGGPASLIPGQVNESG